MKGISKIQHTAHLKSELRNHINLAVITNRETGHKTIGFIHTPTGQFMYQDPYYGFSYYTKLEVTEEYTIEFLKNSDFGRE